MKVLEAPLFYVLSSAMLHVFNSPAPDLNPIFSELHIFLVNHILYIRVYHRCKIFLVLRRTFQVLFTPLATTQKSQLSFITITLTVSFCVSKNLQNYPKFELFSI